MIRKKESVSGIDILFIGEWFNLDDGVSTFVNEVYLKAKIRRALPSVHFFFSFLRTYMVLHYTYYF